jgi:hypothetical protein
MTISALGRNRSGLGMPARPSGVEVSGAAPGWWPAFWGDQGLLCGEGLIKPSLSWQRLLGVQRGLRLDRIRVSDADIAAQHKNNIRTQ